MDAGIRMTMMSLSCAWDLTSEMGISPRNDCKYFISPEKAICHNSQKLEDR